MGTSFQSFAILKYRLQGVKMKMKLAVGRAIKEAFYKWIGLLLKIRHLLFLPPLFFFYWYTSPFYFFSLIFLSYNPLSVFLQRKKHTPSPVSTISCPLAINLYIGKQWWSRSLISRPFDYYFQWMFFEFLHLVWLMMFGRSLGMMMWCACVFLSILVLDFLLFFFFLPWLLFWPKNPLTNSMIVWSKIGLMNVQYSICAHSSFFHLVIQNLIKISRFSLWSL